MVILDEFQEMFEQTIVPFIENFCLEDIFLSPVYYTLTQKSNKFRSATTLLSAKICGGNYDDVVPIAAVSELIHSSIIIQDDIADGDFIRRGGEAAWKKYGMCYALYSSLYVLPPCLKLLDGLKSPNTAQIKDKFLEEYKYVCKAQMEQVLLELSSDMSYEQFLDVHTGKTAIGRWSIFSPAVYYGKYELAQILASFAKKLGDAGSIKNDIEDFLEKNDYEPFCSDIRKGVLTYPIYYYFSQCDQKEQDDFLKFFGREEIINYYEIRQKILDKGAVSHAIEKIDNLVFEAINILKDISPSREKQLLIAWAKHHKYRK